MGFFDRLMGGPIERPSTPDSFDVAALLEKATASERRLSDAIASLSVERAAADAERRRVEEELRAPILECKPIGRGDSRPYRATLEGRENVAVYKPSSQERFFAQETRRGRHLAPREWLAYQIDRALDFRIVPETVLRDGPHGFGSLKDWKKGVMPIMEPTLWDRKARPADLQRGAAFDIMTGNPDRHGGNLLVEDFWLIDNGHTYFPQTLFENIVGKAGRAGILYFKTAGQALQPEVFSELSALRAARPLMAALEEMHSVALGSDAEWAWRTFNSGLDTLVEKRKLSRAIL